MAIRKLDELISDYHLRAHYAALIGWARPYLLPGQRAALAERGRTDRERLNLLVGQIAARPQIMPTEIGHHYVDAVDLLDHPTKPTYSRCTKCGRKHSRRHDWCMVCHKRYDLSIEGENS